MKYLYLSLFILFFATSLMNAQDSNVKKAKLSASTSQYLWRIENEHVGKPTPLQEYVYKQDHSGTTYISTMIKVQPEFNEHLFSLIGAHVGTKAGNIWTVQVPTDKMKAFTLIDGIQYIEMDQPSYPELDSARRATKVDSVQKGYGLPQAYSGHNVVVGIVDAGFDYTHPTFYDTAYSAYRIKRVWEEKNTSGTPPTGYIYGTEYNDSLSIVTKAHDIITGIHGTHVAGIAAGSGVGSTGDSRFRGMSYNSDIVMVAIYPTAAYWLNTGMTDMLDGMSYIYNYAASVSKPAVVNLSWGCPLGPHDGTSLFSQACNNLVGTGKIFVLSGGNNGADNIHLKKTFTPTDTVVNTFLTFSGSLTEKRNQVDVWGDSAKTFCMKFSLYSGSLEIDSTMLVCLDNSTHQYNLIGSGGDTCFITVTTVSSEFNGKPHMLIQACSKVVNRLMLTIKANEGAVNMWQGYVLNTSGYYGAFTNYGLGTAVSGDKIMTVSDMVTTSSAIGVAAYNSKPTYTNILGATLSYTGYPKGAIASFSSKGPTADGRTKPNIAGPGLALASSINSMDSTYMPAGENYNSVVSSYTSPLNGKTYSYAMAAGTSMAGPAVSGIVGLLLEADPTLNQERVMSILANTAIRDSYTGTIPPEGSNTWGWGKVNAYHAMLEVLGMTTGIHHLETNINCILFPNPNNGNYTIDYVGDKDETLTIEVFDATGKKIINQQWTVSAGDNKHAVNLDTRSPGIYFTQITGKQGRTTVKIVKQ